MFTKGFPYSVNRDIPSTLEKTFVWNKPSNKENTTLIDNKKILMIFFPLFILDLHHIIDDNVDFLLPLKVFLLNIFITIKTQKNIILS